jgi:hypothetical protein
LTIKDEVSAFADRITRLGFIVHIAKSRTYGFITDDTARRVLSFSFNDGGSLSGNYGPPSTESGTGWRLEKSPYSLATAKDVREALYAAPPEWVRRRGVGWRYLSTVEQYLQQYDSSSQFTIFTPTESGSSRL